MEKFSQVLNQITGFLEVLRFNESLVTLYGTVVRFLLPVLALLILIRCAKSLLTFRKEPEIWAWLQLSDGTELPITHWENVIGRAKGSDIVIDIATISKSHAVLTRYDDGSWTISDIGSRGGVFVNGRQVEIVPVDENDIISLGSLEMRLIPNSRQEQARQASIRTKAGHTVSAGLTLVLLTLLQILASLQLIMVVDAEYIGNVAFGFAIMTCVQWLLFLVMKFARRHGFEVETLAFFLSTIGMSIVTSAAPEDVFKQLAASVMGIVLYLILGWCLRDLERAKKIRYIAAVVGIALLLFNLVFGTEQYGARNWIYIAGISFQPSELVKLCFILVGASTLERIVTKRNLLLFIVYSGFICLCLVLMNDFGTALIFFVTFLIIAFLRSGNFAGLAMICAGIGFAGVLAVRFRPHIAQRFSAWGHVWEYATSTGYQQTRAMMVIASGGLFGLGLGNGWLKYVAASDTDLVFAFVSEEWGLLVALMMVIVIIVLAVFVFRSVSVGRSSFYTIGACAAITVMVTQTILNVFGTVDILPLTGVTFPFVSNGGSSMMSAWGLLAFIKAADTRQNASFAVKTVSRRDLKAEERRRAQEEVQQMAYPETDYPYEMTEPIVDPYDNFEVQIDEYERYDGYTGGQFYDWSSEQGRDDYE